MFLFLAQSEGIIRTTAVGKPGTAVTAEDAVRSQGGSTRAEDPLSELKGCGTSERAE